MVGWKQWCLGVKSRKWVEWPGAVSMLNTYRHQEHLQWQHHLLLICAHATVFRHWAHIRFGLHIQNKWASGRRQGLTGAAVAKMGSGRPPSFSHYLGILSRPIFNQSITGGAVLHPPSTRQATSGLIWHNLTSTRGLLVTGSWKSQTDYLSYLG